MTATRPTPRRISLFRRGESRKARNIIQACAGRLPSTVGSVVAPAGAAAGGLRGSSIDLPSLPGATIAAGPLPQPDSGPPAPAGFDPFPKPAAPPITKAVPSTTE